MVEGLVGSKTVLRVFPTGTMNVFAKEMGIPYDRLESALEVIDAGKIGEVDLFAMNGAPFVQMAGVGFDAQVIEETTVGSKKILGPLAYLYSASRVLRTKLPRIRVEMPNGEVEKGVAVLVGNGALYGGKFPLFKGADNTDELMDVILFKKGGIPFIKATLRSYAQGGVDPDDPGDSVSYFQAKSLKVWSKRPVPVEVDGELWGRSEEIEFGTTGKTLRVFVP